MHKVEFVPSSHFRDKYEHALDTHPITFKPDGMTAELVCSGAHLVGDWMVCIMEQNYLYIVPLDKLVKVEHLTGTPAADLDFSAQLYIEVDPSTKEPTGVATFPEQYNIYCLAKGGLDLTVYDISEGDMELSYYIINMANKKETRN